MKKEHIYQMRAFNRFYTNVLGLLDKHILNSNYSLIEARILFELHNKRKLTASDIMADLDIDKGYLSRILKRFEENGLIKRVSSFEDKRAFSLEITPKGANEYQILNNASDKQTESLFENLSEQERDQLIQKVIEIEKLIKKGIRV